MLNPNETMSKNKQKKTLAQTAQLPIAGAVSANPVPGGLQNANMASIELGKKRMRDSNDDLLMVPRLLHDYAFFIFCFSLEKKDGSSLENRAGNLVFSFVA